MVNHEQHDGCSIKRKDHKKYGTALGKAGEQARLARSIEQDQQDGKRHAREESAAARGGRELL